jgi:hypothetical protein
VTGTFLRSNLFAREVYFGAVLGRGGTGAEGREVGDYNLVEEGRTGRNVEQRSGERDDHSLSRVVERRVGMSRVERVEGYMYECIESGWRSYNVDRVLSERDFGNDQGGGNLTG